MITTQPLHDEWYYLDGTKPVGPFTRDVMRQLSNVGMISGETLVRSPIHESWQRLKLAALDEVVAADIRASAVR
jgi:hypothetical protein